MKKFNLFVTVLVILFLATSADLLFSQNGIEISREDLDDIIARNVIPEIKSTETIGSPYFFDSFRDGKIVLANDKITETFKMNYNMYENHLEIADGNSVLVIHADKIQGFQFQKNTGTVVFTKGYNAKNLKPEEFVLKLVDGDVIPLVKFETSFQQNIASYGSATQKDEYITKTTLYIHKNGETERIRRMRERTILRSLNSHRDEMRNFIRENDLDLQEISDLKTFFTHYNQLLKS